MPPCPPPRGGGRGKKKKRGGGGHHFWVCACPVHIVVVRRGRGRWFPFPRGPPICVPDLHTNGGGGWGIPRVRIPPPPRTRVACRPSAVLRAPTVHPSSHF